MDSFSDTKISASTLRIRRSIKELREIWVFSGYVIEGKTRKHHVHGITD